MIILIVKYFYSITLHFNAAFVYQTDRTVSIAEVNLISISMLVGDFTLKYYRVQRKCF